MDALLSSLPSSNSATNTTTIPPTLFLCASCSVPVSSSASLVCYHPGTTSLLFTHALVAPSQNTPPILPPAAAPDAFCPYIALHCGQCNMMIGRRYVATTPKLPELLERHCFGIEKLAVFRVGQEQEREQEQEEDGVGKEAMPVVLDPGVMRYLHPEPEVVPEWIGKVMGVMVVMKEELDTLRAELDALREQTGQRGEDGDVDMNMEMEVEPEMGTTYDQQRHQRRESGVEVRMHPLQVIPDSQGSDATAHRTSPGWDALRRGRYREQQQQHGIPSQDDQENNGASSSSPPPPPPQPQKQKKKPPAATQSTASTSLPSAANQKSTSPPPAQQRHLKPRQKNTPHPSPPPSSSSKRPTADFDSASDADPAQSSSKHPNSSSSLRRSASMRRGMFQHQQSSGDKQPAMLPSTAATTFYSSPVPRAAAAATGKNTQEPQPRRKVGLRRRDPSPTRSPSPSQSALHSNDDEEDESGVRDARTRRESAGRRSLRGAEKEKEKEKEREKEKVDTNQDKDMGMGRPQARKRKAAVAEVVVQVGNTDPRGTAGVEGKRRVVTRRSAGGGGDV